MKATLGRIAEWVDGRLFGDPERLIENVVTDTRRHFSQSSLFVALRGPRFDGHDFVSAALERGAVLLVEPGRVSEGTRIEVEDTLAALQSLAAAWRAQFEGEVVGITGSHGKTIVKEMLAAILSSTVRVVRSPGSYNSQVGVALALLEIEEAHEVAIIEAGVSELGEMGRLEQMIRPTCGVLTSIGEAHFDGLGRDLRSTAAEKMELFRRVEGPVILPASAKMVDASSLAKPRLFHVEHSESGYRVEEVAREGKGFEVSFVSADGARGAFRLHAPGRYNVSNAMAAATMALELGTPMSQVVAGLESFEPTPMRMEMHTTQSGITILNDAYVSDPTSARSAVEELVFYGAGHRTVAILGDMRELGVLAADAHRALGEFVAESGVDRLVAVGKWATAMVEGAVAKGMAAADAEAREALDGLALDLEEWLVAGDFVLFKGSRAIGLESVAAGLVESVAPERLEVDLDAICDNVRGLREQLGSAEIMAVVKSFAYGNDATRVSQTLVREGVRWLAVAYPDEAIPLRRKGIDVPILVTNVLASEADKFAKYQLTALVSTRTMIDALDRAASGRGEVVDVHLEVDTGMSRMGARPDEAVELAAYVASKGGVELRGAMTHFAAADDPAEDDFTRGQIARFDATVAAIRAAGHDLEVVHAANTAAAWRFPEARYDVVRVGLGLYGVAPSTAVGAAGTFRLALRFTSRVLQVRDVEAGESVGYGRTWRADRPSRIATVAIGYNDGFPRFMSNGGEVLIRGHRCPVVGNVCMDATMVDVTEVEGVVEGDEVVLFGAQNGARIEVDELARRGNTITYEILTGISPRVRRIFRRGER